MERVLCEKCHQKFFGSQENKYECPKCDTIYIRKNKKTDIQDLLNPGISAE